MLENVGIICNKNTLPGDLSSSDATGLRFGVPWLTQRGITGPQLQNMAKITKDLLSSATGFKVFAPNGDEKARSRVPFEQLQKAKDEVLAIARALPYPPRDVVPAAAVVISSSNPISDREGLLVRGEKARLALNQALSCNVLGLTAGKGMHGLLMNASGKIIDDVAVVNLGFRSVACGVENGEEQFALFPHSSRVKEVREWLQALSDGYVLIKKDDPMMKVDGPFVVEALPAQHSAAADVVQISGMYNIRITHFHRGVHKL